MGKGWQAPNEARGHVPRLQGSTGTAGRASVTAHVCGMEQLESFGLVGWASSGCKSAVLASARTLASPLGPWVCRGSTDEAGVAQSPVVLAGSGERRAGGGFSSSPVAEAEPARGSGFGRPCAGTGGTAGTEQPAPAGGCPPGLRPQAAPREEAWPRSHAMQQRLRVPSVTCSAWSSGRDRAPATAA